jgi:hypothetical protein
MVVVAPQLQQMKNRFKAKYDYDGAKTMELEVVVAIRTKENGLFFLS